MKEQDPPHLECPSSRQGTQQPEQPGNGDFLSWLRSYLPLLEQTEVSGSCLPEPHQTYACGMQSTDNQGTVLVIKAPGRDIESLRGRVPIHLRQELHAHPKAPVIRMVLTIYDQSGRHLPFDMFVNVEDRQQRADYASLADQKELLLFFYDEQGQHRLTKQIATPRGAVKGDVLTRAARLTALIDRDQFDFDAAKEAVLRYARL